MIVNYRISSNILHNIIYNTCDKLKYLVKATKDMLSVQLN